MRWEGPGKLADQRKDSTYVPPLSHQPAPPPGGTLTGLSHSSQHSDWVKEGRSSARATQGTAFPGSNQSEAWSFLVNSWGKENVPPVWGVHVKSGTF